MSWSSGKDSAWTLHTLNQQHPGAVAALLTTYNEAFDRVAMHGVRRAVLEAQADAAGLPLWQVPIPDQCTNEIYDARMRETCARAVTEGFTHVAFGDLFLEDIRRYREERLADSGLTPLFPLWKIPTPELARQMIADGLQATISVVDTRVLPAEFAGRSFDDALLRDLPAGVDPCAENGEFHSCVTAGPMFRQPLAVTVGERVDRPPFAFRDIVLAGAAA
ncbi:MAG: ATP-binding protein [Vicinamibacterales bacterium]